MGNYPRLTNIAVWELRSERSAMSFPPLKKYMDSTYYAPGQENIDNIPLEDMEILEDDDNEDNN